MNGWVRNAVMLGAMTVWSVYVVAQILRREQVEATLWAVPGALYFALNPVLPRRNGRNGGGASHG